MSVDMTAYLWVPLEVSLSNIKGRIKLITSDFVWRKYPEGARIHFDNLSHVVAHAICLSEAIPLRRKTKITLSYLRLSPPRHDHTPSIQEFQEVRTHGTLPAAMCQVNPPC